MELTATTAKIGHHISHKLLKLRFMGSRGRLENYDFFERAVAARHNPSTIVEALWRDDDAARHPRRAIYRDIAESKEKSFSDRLRPWIPDVDYQLLSAGENNGDMAAGLRAAIQNAEDMAELRASIIGPLIYPMVLLMILGALLMALAYGDIWGSIEEVFGRENWSDNVANLAAFSEFLAANLPYLLALGIAGVIGLLYALPRWKGPVRSFFDQYVPPFTLYRFFYSIIFLKTLSALLKGAPDNLRHILMRLTRNATPWYRYYLMKTANGLKGATAEWIALDTELMDPKNIRYLKHTATDGERFYLALSVLAERAIEDAKLRFKVAGRVTNALVLMTISFVIMWCMGALYSMGLDFVDFIEMRTSKF